MESIYLTELFIIFYFLIDILIVIMKSGKYGVVALLYHFSIIKNYIVKIMNTF